MDEPVEPSPSHAITMQEEEQEDAAAEATTIPPVVTDPASSNHPIPHSHAHGSSQSAAPEADPNSHTAPSIDMLMNPQSPEREKTKSPVRDRESEPPRPGPDPPAAHHPQTTERNSSPASPATEPAAVKEDSFSKRSDEEVGIMSHYEAMRAEVARELAQERLASALPPPPPPSQSQPKGLAQHQLPPQQQFHFNPHQQSQPLQPLQLSQPTQPSHPSQPMALNQHFPSNAAFAAPQYRTQLPSSHPLAPPQASRPGLQIQTQPPLPYVNPPGNGVAGSQMPLHPTQMTQDAFRQALAARSEQQQEQQQQQQQFAAQRALMLQSGNVPNASGTSNGISLGPSVEGIADPAVDAGSLSDEENDRSDEHAKPFRDPMPLWEKTLDVFLAREEAYKLAMKKQSVRNAARVTSKRHEFIYLQQKHSDQVKLGQQMPFELVPGRRRKHDELVFTEEQLQHMAEAQESLVPIRLDIDFDGVKLRDTFTWNLNETLVRPAHIAELMCEDLHLPPAIFIPAIEKAIEEQISDYRQHTPVALGLTDGDTRGNDGLDSLDKDSPELRTVIKLDITVGNHCLVDQFEWDLNCKRNNPELFADHMCAELGLGSEFKTAIAHQIREQIQTFAKSLLLVDHQFNGAPIDDDELSSCFLAPVDPVSVYRSVKDKAMFGPYYNAVTDLEIEKMEKDRDRDTR
ncbi:SWI/SNF chromatin-remodeling complex subunit [Thoreauomyces humboldtii]|nr:SWI/SNF chromatin-remodeling complex subunit [Thoreauomyces humboldtii]